MKIAVFLLLLPCSLAAGTPLTIEAESASLLGAVRIARENPDGTGRAWVTGFVQPADAIEFTVNVAADGDYFLEIVCSADGDKNVPVTVNGNFLGSPRLPKTAGFESRLFGRIRLAAGANSLRIGTDWGYTDIDSIRISPAPPPVAFSLRNSPVTPRASAEARALYATLIREFGRRTFSGQHESDVRKPSRLTRIARVADGAAPAILGLDLLYYSGSWNQSDDGTVGAARDWALSRRGIVTLSWHWFAPLQPGPLIWDSFSANKTPFDVTRIADETTPEYAAVVRDLDRVAEKLKILRDARIPVLWRPLHEAEGGWFWWGAKGPDAAKRLYALMFDRFTRVHHLDNLLWVWTTTGDDTAPAWYPGDDYVDILAADLYPPAGARGDFSTVFDRIRTLYAGRKPIALGECGALPAINAGSPWLWFLCWDDFITRDDVNPSPVIANTYASPRVITLPRLSKP